jgi:ATP-dependent RNA helicase DeaD
VSTFKELGISPDYIKGLSELGIVTPTEVQAQTIPALLGKKTDLVGQAQTGTGKTAAFGLPLLANVDAKQKQIQAVVLAPTRELAKQIQKQLFRFTKYTDPVFSYVVCGGDKIDKQIESLKRPTQVLVATPGRLVDLMIRKAVDISQVQTLVLDEADEMLKMGFKDELDQIMAATGSRNIWLFSATMPGPIKQIITKQLSKNAPFIQIDKKHIVNQNIRHQIIRCKDDEKLENILQFLKDRGEQRGLIFCRTRAETIAFGEMIGQSDVSCLVLHGDLTQPERDKIMRSFRKGRARVLVTTDVAARGIDVEGISFVIHHKLPEKSESYTHRSGRTARAGKTGISLALVNRYEAKLINDFQRDLGISFHVLK